MGSQLPTVRNPSGAPQPMESPQPLDSPEPMTLVDLRPRSGVDIWGRFAVDLGPIWVSSRVHLGSISGHVAKLFADLHA